MMKYDLLLSLATLTCVASAFSLTHQVGRRTPFHPTTAASPTLHGASHSSRFSSSSRREARLKLLLLQSSSGPSNTNEHDDSTETKLSQLGYSEQEIKQRKPPGRDDINVNVNLVNDVDPVTLTVIGFTLLAINFFLLANAGDGGIAGTVASIINLSKQ